MSKSPARVRVSPRAATGTAICILATAAAALPAAELLPSLSQAVAAMMLLSSSTAPAVRPAAKPNAAASRTMTPASTATSNPARPAPAANRAMQTAVPVNNDAGVAAQSWSPNTPSHGTHGQVRNGNTANAVVINVDDPKSAEKVARQLNKIENKAEKRAEREEKKRDKKGVMDDGSGNCGPNTTHLC